jgi:hypothetical protein
MYRCSPLLCHSGSRKVCNSLLSVSTPGTHTSDMTKFSAGKLLIASPLIVDPVFGRSVCLIVHHDANGAMGVLLNRPLQFGNAKLWSMLLSGSHEHQDPAKPKDFRPPDLKREVPKAKDLRTGVALSPSPAGESGVCSRPLVHFGGAFAWSCRCVTRPQKFSRC